jgi:hypothetical protein
VDGRELGRTYIWMWGTLTNVGARVDPFNRIMGNAITLDKDYAPCTHTDNVI